jgi:uncharacterized ParB-like nuclease family protein
MTSTICQGEILLIDSDKKYNYYQCSGCERLHIIDKYIEERGFDLI